MKFVLIWLAVSGPGTMTSGSAEFETKAACEAAKTALRESYNKLDIEIFGKRAGSVSGFEAGCAEKGSK